MMQGFTWNRFLCQELSRSTVFWQPVIRHEPSDYHSKALDEHIDYLSMIDMKELQTPRANQLNPPKAQSPRVAVSLTGKERACTLLSKIGESV
jgi:hypothetical protein